MSIRKAYKPDYYSVYPGVELSDEVLEVLRKSDRKMEYMECDLKHSRKRRDTSGKIVVSLPREDSLERLMEQGKRFSSNQSSVEDEYFEDQRMQWLYWALDQLPADERELIDALFFRNISEGRYAELTGQKQQNIHKQKRQIVNKLKIFLKNGC